MEYVFNLLQINAQTVQTDFLLAKMVNVIQVLLVAKHTLPQVLASNVSRPLP